MYSTYLYLQYLRCYTITCTVIVIIINTCTHNENMGVGVRPGSQYDVTGHWMTLGLTLLSIKIVLLYRQEHGCSSELPRCNASDAGIEIKSIPVFQRNVIT